MDAASFHEREFRTRLRVAGKTDDQYIEAIVLFLSHQVPQCPLPLMKDGDLIATIHSMLSLRGFDTVKVSKVKGHATRAMVDSGDVRLDDLVGNNGADAADFGRISQQDDVITASS